MSSLSEYKEFVKSIADLEKMDHSTTMSEDRNHFKMQCVDCSLKYAALKQGTPHIDSLAMLGEWHKHQRWCVEHQELIKKGADRKKLEEKEEQIKEFDRMMVNIKLRITDKHYIFMCRKCDYLMVIARQGTPSDEGRAMQSEYNKHVCTAD